VTTALDARRVRQILLNLVANAVKFTEKGAVGVTVAARGSEIRVEVRDTGPGIAPEDHARIFTAWERVAHNGQDGHGLGLAIASDLASQMGARIELESELGKGARFTLVLPYREPA
jgi:signal transduction histidine kinase